MWNTLYICIIIIGTIMTLPIQALGHNPSYERNARPINFFAQPGAIPPLVGGGNEPTGIAAINGEITPTYAQQDTSYTNGLGHSKHNFMWNI